MTIALWIILGVVAVVFFVAVFKSQDLIFIFNFFRKNFFYVILLFFILFIAYSVYSISIINDVSFTSFDGVLNAGKLYFLWVKSIFSNLGNTVGYVVKQDWVLNNNTIK